MVSVIIPLHNAATHLPALLTSLKEQTQPHELILIDSESSDATQDILAEANLSVTQIKKTHFNHGSTRNLGMELASTNTLVYLTQDALPVTSFSIERLVQSLHNSDSIAMAYGRQLPYANTGVFGRFARLINYPGTSLIKTKALIPTMGIKTCSCSNSFAAYRKNELESVGGFPSNTILGEDVSVAARFILQEKAVAYCAEAEVYHSHDYSLLEEFRRYFDIGVFHEEQQSILKEFRQAESEGLKYIIDELSYLRHSKSTHLIPEQLIRTIAKYVGYRLGRNEQFLPELIKVHLSMHKSFWNKPHRPSIS
jgi:rhamnosyltransferase